MKPKIIKIYSENNDFQRVEVIKRNRNKRHKYNEFFVEGVQAINSLIKHEWTIKSLLYTKDKPLSEWAKYILENSKAKTHLEMPFKLMKKLSEKDENTSELIAVVEIPDNNLSRIKLKKDLLIVIFDRPSNYGNLGTLIRSCEALKVDGIIVTGHAVDLYDPKTIRGSMGTFFSIPTIKCESHNDLIPWFNQIKNQYQDFKVVGSTSKANSIIEDVELSNPVALLIGNETHGLSNNYINLCDEIVKIPMYGDITSFNVSCAASIMLYEIDRQRRKVSKQFIKIMFKKTLKVN